MKAAVYTGTRNLYKDMVTAAKSLLANSSVDRVYFLVEDDVFPYEIPPCIETINVSGQQIFRPGSVNFSTPFSYMCLLRVAYGAILPKELDKVLQLDVDTVIVDNIDRLWDIDLEGKWFAAVEEYNSTYKPYGPTYYNAGVMMINLKQIREDRIEDELIRILNTAKLSYIDQDAWNAVCGSKAEHMEVQYNESFVTGYTEKPAIVHFAGIRDWQASTRCCRREYLKKYREMSWREVMEVRNNG